MAKQQRTAITPTRAEDYSEWYQQVIRAADMAEPSPVRGCMVIKPWGYAIWENMQRRLDDMFKATGHKNAYFPLFIPLSYMEKEAKHVEGFAKECAVVTHHRLEADGQGGLKPAGELEEPLVVRPTSETIIGEMFSRWIQSHRDLPLLINQWANVVRWEMRTRLFLRTSEFLWQEGHTAHATREEAIEHTERMLEVYRDFVENDMAMPVVAGRKSASERFPGAEDTYCIEAMMQDRKALQAGTSHFLAQNFSQAAEIRFQDDEGNLEHVWTTSWGMSTRLVGALIMSHSDDDGLVLPPKLAPVHVVIMPIAFKADDPQAVLDYCDALADELRAQTYDGKPLRVEVDNRDIRGGEKSWGWVKQGVPVRVEVGPRDMAKDAVFTGRRDRAAKDKASVGREDFVAGIGETLAEIQDVLYQRALEFKKAHTRVIDDEKEFYAFFTAENEEEPEIHGGFALTHWSGDEAVEERIKTDLGVTIRLLIPLEDLGDGAGICPFDGKPSERRVVWAKAY